MPLNKRHHEMRADWIVGWAMGCWFRSTMSHGHTRSEESDGKRVREKGTRKERMFNPSQRAWVSKRSKQDPE